MMHALLLVSVLAGPDRTAPEPDYEAHGSEPFWDLEVSGKRITFRNEGEQVFERAQWRTAGAARVWEARRGNRTIRVEARAEPCTDEADKTYADTVRVIFGEFEFSGCGGVPLTREED
jgi:uncharacterized membrane protein